MRELPAYAYRWPLIRHSAAQKKKIFGKHGERVRMRTFRGVVISLGFFFSLLRKFIVSKKANRIDWIVLTLTSREYNCERVKGIRRFDLTAPSHCVASAKTKCSICIECVAELNRFIVHWLPKWAPRAARYISHRRVGGNAVKFDTCQNRIRLSGCPVGSCLY